MSGTLTIKSGDTKTLRFKLVDENDVAVDISSYTSIKFKIASSLDVSNSDALEYREILAASFTDAANGIHDEVIDDATTAAYTPGDYKYQARWIDGSGVVTSFDVGVCVITENLLDDE